MTAVGPLSPAGPELIAARSKAIEESGWGHRFNPIQPRNLAFWTYLLIVGYAVLIEWQQLGATANAYQDALTLSIVVSAIVTFVFGWFLNRLDRFASTPTLLRVVAFGWGALPAIGMAVYGNNAILSLWSKGRGAVFAAHWSAALTAPFVEEPSKGAGMLLLIALAPRLIRSPFDGFILGSFIGLGFQVVEDVTYAVNSAASAFGANQLSNGGKTLGIRIATAIPSHWMFSGIFCAGLIWLVGRPDSPPRRLLGVLLMLTAMLMHGLWDGISGFVALSSGLSFLPFLIGLALIGIYAAVYKASVRTERNWMHEMLAPEVPLGILTPAELDVIAASRHQRKAYLKSIKDHHTRRSEKHVIEAATELGLQLARDHGADTQDVGHLRNEVVRLRSN